MTQNVKELDSIFNFFRQSNQMKKTYRYGSAKNFQGDTSADHSWRLALMVFIVYDYLKLDFDLAKALKIALIHDLPESITGDIPSDVTMTNRDIKKQKEIMEQRAVETLKKMLPENLGENFVSLWNEFDGLTTREGRFVNALDKMEALLHISENGIKSFDRPDLAGIYGNEDVELAPELLPVIRKIKNDLKVIFKENELEWKGEYEV